MTHWLVTRHPGAEEWVRRRGIQVDRQVDHLDVGSISEGDTVIGTLPVNLAAEVCRRGGHYIHLALEVPPHLRGEELSADQLKTLDAELVPYRVTRLE